MSNQAARLCTGMILAPRTIRVDPARHLEKSMVSFVIICVFWRSRVRAHRQQS